MQSKKHEKLFGVSKPKIISSVLIMLIITFISVPSVTATTVLATVIDRDRTYQFYMNSVDVDDIIEKAVSEGMEPIDETDIFERVNNTTTINVKRGLSFSVEDGENLTDYITYEGYSVEKALYQNGVLLKEKDAVSPSLDTIVTADMKITVKRQLTINLYYEGRKEQVILYGGTVQDALEQAGYAFGDDVSINYDPSCKLIDNMNIRILSKVKYKITADKASKEYEEAVYSVQDALMKAGIKLSKEDRVTPGLETKVKNGVEIVVQRVEVKEETRKEEIPFETEQKETDTLFEGITEVASAGIKGEKEILYSVTFVDGAEEKKEVLKESVLKPAEKEVILVGTKQQTEDQSTSETDSSSGASEYSSVLTGLGTAYCDYGLTATGNAAGWGYAAVNPNVIPYGTRLYIRTTDGAYERYCVAADTGGAMQSGNVLVDLWFPDEAQCVAFGVRNIEVYILD